MTSTKTKPKILATRLFTR